MKTYMSLVGTGSVVVGTDSVELEVEELVNSEGARLSPQPSMKDPMALIAKVGEPEPECIPAYPLPVEVFELADETPTPEPVVVSRVCDVLGLVGTDDTQLRSMVDDFSVYTYRPKVPMGSGDWPEFKLPYVIFSPGNAQFAADVITDESYYREVIEAYTSVGFVVFAIQPPFDEWLMGRRARAMACTAIWAFSTWSESENDRLNCDFVVSGHSRGGEAAYFFADNLANIYDMLSLTGRVLRGVVALAPRSRGEVLIDGDDVSGHVSGALARPYLILHGANDEDVTNGPTRAFEIYGDEEVGGLPEQDKFLLWAHDILHNDWGGGPSVPTAKAGAIESVYIPAFMRWQILGNGDPLDRELFADVVHYDRSSVSFDSSLEMTGFWDQCAPEFMDMDETAVIFGDFSPGLKGDPDARLQVDTMLRTSLTACSSSVSPSSSSASVVLTGLTSGATTSQVCMGSTLNLISPVPTISNRDEREHIAASAMRVRWGDTESGGAIAWTVDEDLTDYSFLSLRVGHIDHLSPEAMSTINVGIVTGVELFSVDVNVYTQDDSPASSLEAFPPRDVTDFMRTIRIPLSNLCDLGADVSDVSEIVITFPEEDESRAVLIDSLEFTKASDIMEGGQCS